MNSKDQHQIAGTFTANISGEFLPAQLIYTGQPSEIS